MTTIKTDNTWKSLCDSCSTKSCCKSFSGANLLPSEFIKIKAKTGQKEFANTVTYNNIPTQVIKKKQNSDECIFWDSEKECCTIYENRPFDCKLFPFDIHEINGKYMWVINTCNPDADWTWTESMLRSFENDPAFLELVKALGSYSYPESTKNSLYDIKVLRQVNY